MKRFKLHHGPGTTWMVSGLPATALQSETVTVYDARDVDPLIRNAQEAVTKLQGDPRNREPEAVAHHLQKALKRFEESGGDH